MLDLSPITLLFVETRAHEITRRVIEDCLTKVVFGDIVVFTDKPEVFAGLPVRLLPCIDFPNKKEAGRFYYSEAMAAVTTDFALMLEWDAGIYDETKWKAEFFDYDYIGAPWVVRHGETHDVGNGGFTLISRKLGHALCDHRRDIPVYTDMDVCRFARTKLEPLGFKWPQADLASRFAWELGPRNPEHFGYHGAFNWPTLLPRDEVIARAKIMIKSDYLALKLRDVFKSAPWLESEMTVEEWERYLTVVPVHTRLQPRIPGMMSAQQRQAMMLMQAQRRNTAPTPIRHLNGSGLKA